MFKHYIKTAFRFLRRNKLYTIINALGLSISLAVSFIILLFVINEYSFNHSHKKRNQVYRVVNYYKEFKQSMAGTPYVLAKTLKEDFPQVERAINVRYLRGFKLKLEEEYIDIRQPLATDSEVFDIFTIPFVGSQLNENPLQELNSIVISQKLADQFFPGKDPVGREIEGLINNTEQLLIVGGVFEDIPRNSTFRADCFLNGRWTLEPLNKAFGVTDMDVNWAHDFWNTWLLLAEDADASEIEDQFEAFEKKHISEDPYCHYSLQNLTDVYLRSAGIANSGLTGDIKNIRLFSTVALLILLIAAINYIILSIAVSTGRAKEIGIRKTAGASVARIRNQVLSESIMLSLLVLPAALCFMWLFKPAAEKLFQTSLEVIRSNVVIYTSFYLLLTLLIGIASGLYASTYLSRMKVLDVFKQKVSFGRKRKIFRSSLIVIQLVIFCSFVAGTLLIRSQYQYALSKDPGYHNHDILQIDLGRDFAGYDAVLNGIRAIPEVKHAAGAMDGLPMAGWMTYMQKHFKDEEVKVKMEGFAVDYGFLETLGFTLLEGRSFSSDFGRDLENSVILNETAVRELGIDEPLGQFLYDTTAIIGVVKDFNLHSIHTEIPPLVISMTDKYLNYILIQYRSGTLADLIPKLEAEWKEVEPDRPFRSVTIEELFEEAYASEKNLGTILSIAALFTLLIAAFGLFGLTLFVARSRTHEIGIKKVFGSSERAIVYSFLRSNFIMVVLAELLSIPLTLYFIGKWLNDFPYRVGIGWWVFLIAFLIATLVVLLTVSIHSIKASRINPVDALRYE
ncbi:MAG: ABC transporter permease [Bacteroidales bacterium]|nr:ABC transporter permease [Bacteroidales bacterium]